MAQTNTARTPTRACAVAIAAELEAVLGGAWRASATQWGNDVRGALYVDGNCVHGRVSYVDAMRVITGAAQIMEVLNVHK